MVKDDSFQGEAEVGMEQLLRAIETFLIEDVIPEMEGRHRFNARVAANALGIVQREQQLAPQLAELDSKAAERWLKKDTHKGNTAQAFARALATRSIDLNQEFLDYLRQRQLLVTSINTPHYASRSIAIAKWSDAGVKASDFGKQLTNSEM